MGFRKGAFAKVWDVRPYSDTSTSLRISISRKDRSTGEFKDDFSGYVQAVGTAAAKKAACLKPGDRIQLGDVDISNSYNKKENTTSYFCKVFSFEMADSAPKHTDEASTEPQPAVDSGEIDDSRLPF